MINKTEALEIAKAHNLFFSADTGCPAVIDINAPKIMQPMHRNDNWRNYCNTKGINPLIAEFLPRLSTTFDMNIPSGINEDKGLFNLYYESEVLQGARATDIKISKENRIMNLQLKCPTIYWVLENVFGMELEHFINWLAAIIQGKKKLFTYWIISTVPGAGKNLMAEHVLKPLFGKPSVQVFKSCDMERTFNAQDATLIFKVLDELFTDNRVDKNRKRLEWLKSEVGTTEHRIELKGVDAVTLPSFTHYLCFSNRGASAFTLERTDRRAFVANNKASFELALHEDWPGIDQIESLIAKELRNFAILIAKCDVNYEAANRACDSSAKNEMQLASQEIVDTFVNIFKEKKWADLEIESIPELNNIYSTSLDVIYKDIEAFGGIPANIYAIIAKNYLGSLTPMIRRRLKMSGIDSIAIKDANRNSIRVYKYIADKLESK